MGKRGKRGRRIEDKARERYGKTEEGKKKRYRKIGKLRSREGKTDEEGRKRYGKTEEGEGRNTVC